MVSNEWVCLKKGKKEKSGHVFFKTENGTLKYCHVIKQWLLKNQSRCDGDQSWRIRLSKGEKWEEL